MAAQWRITLDSSVIQTTQKTTYSPLHAERWPVRRMAPKEGFGTWTIHPSPSFFMDPVKKDKRLRSSCLLDSGLAPTRRNCHFLIFSKWYLSKRIFFFFFLGSPTFLNSNHLHHRGNKTHKHTQIRIRFIYFSCYIPIQNKPILSSPSTITQQELYFSISLFGLSMIYWEMNDPIRAKSNMDRWIAC